MNVMFITIIKDGQVIILLQSGISFHINCSFKFPL